MKVYLTTISREPETYDLLRHRARFSTSHVLVDNPRNADLILILGTDATKPDLLLKNPLYLQFPDRCGVYTTDDFYVPLLPGVYCSAEVDQSTRVGRTFSWDYVPRTGMYRNRFLYDCSGTSEAQGKDPAMPSTKKYLFSFQGGSTSLLRKRLFRLRFDRPDVLIENTSAYRNWGTFNTQEERDAFQLRYAETMAESSFVLCPKGAGAGTVRLFECLAKGVAPVLIADKYALPPEIDWDSFLLRCLEKDIHKLPEFLMKHRETAQARGATARCVYEKCFRTEVEFDRIIGLVARSLRHQLPAEITFRNRQRRWIKQFQIRQGLRNALRRCVLVVSDLTGFNPIGVQK